MRVPIALQLFVGPTYLKSPAGDSDIHWSWSTTAWPFINIILWSTGLGLSPLPANEIWIPLSYILGPSWSTPACPGPALLLVVCPLTTQRHWHPLKRSLSFSPCTPLFLLFYLCRTFSHSCPSSSRYNSSTTSSESPWDSHFLPFLPSFTSIQTWSLLWHVIILPYI